MSKELIAKNFSKYAHLYDYYAQIQNQTASELLNLISCDAVEKILEIGCGTGNYTILLRDKFKTAQLKAVDISENMVEIAAKKLKNKNVDFLVSDAEGIDFDENFELITSNACLQWFNDLEAALLRYKKLLKKDSHLLFSIFGPETFRELSAVLKIIFKKEANIKANQFNSREKIKDVLTENFNCVETKEAIYTESFSSFKGLLEKIKYSGIRGAGLNGKVLFTSGILKKLEEAYLDKFKQLKVTYQVFYCQAQK